MWWLNHIIPAHVSIVAKNIVCCMWKTSQDCMSIYMLWRFEIWENHFNSHNHNCLMGTITFEVHPITPTYVRRHACNHIKAFWFFCFLFFFAYFLFKQIMHGHIRERKEIPNDVKLLTLPFCYAEAHKCHSCLAGNSSEMVIYAFLLGFSSPSR